MYVHLNDDFTIGLNDQPAAIFHTSYSTDIKLSNMQLIWRLPSPYSSKCGDDNGTYSIFPKPYTAVKCRNTCMFNMMLSRCGDVIQQWQIYLPKDGVSTEKEGSRKCIQHLFRDLNNQSLECKCPVSCYDSYVDTTVEHRSGPVLISFSYLSNTFAEIREVPAYPASRFITDIGGWLSLFTGMSVLSLLEVFIFITMGMLALYRALLSRWRNDKLNS